MLRFATFLFCFALMTEVQAFPCFVTVLKDKCWKDYEVAISIKDVIHDKVDATITIPKNQLWGRGKFECIAKEELGFIAQFSPVIWKGQEGLKYPAIHDWFLPETIKPDTTAWNVTLCFPNDFADVPMPPGDMTKCGCDNTGIPDIPPQS